MRIPVPNSFGSFDVEAGMATLIEFNACHDPKSGEFCSTTRVGITSSRPGRSNREIFRTMRAFEGQLKGLPGVRDVNVQPGVGGWRDEKGDLVNESSWVVSYRGNGEATRLLAQAGKDFDQDAVLQMKGCKGRNCDPAVEFRFAGGVSKAQRREVEELLTANGISGWTWFKSGGKTKLRMVSVPAWGGNRRKHTKATRKISALLAERGLAHKSRTRAVRTNVLNRGNYDAVIGAIILGQSGQPTRL